MNKKQLKTVLKPLIKECIKEVIFEEGVLSSVIKEVVKGTTAQVVTETPEPRPTQVAEARVNSKKAALAERKKKLLARNFFCFVIDPEMSIKKMMAAFEVFFS